RPRAQLAAQRPLRPVRRDDRRHARRDVLPVLYLPVRVPEPLDDDGVRLVIVEVGVVLQRAGVLRAHDLHRLSRESLDLLDLALVKLEPHDPEELTHEWHAAHADACASRPIALLAVASGCDLPAALIQNYLPLTALLLVAESPYPLPYQLSYLG